MIERDFAEGFVRVGRVHLVGPLVAAAEVGGRADRVAKRAVKCRGVLGRVGQDAHVLEAGFVERPADRADAAVHHVGRGDHVAAGLGLHDRLPAEHVDRFVVHDVAVAHQAVLAVAGVRVEGHVADDADRVAVGRLHRPHGPADQILGIDGLLGRRAFFWPGR